MENLIVLMATNRTDEPYVQKAVSINNRYCENHRYKFELIDLNRHKEFITEGRTLHWCKIRIVLRYLLNYKHVMWIDDDAIFVDHDKSLSHILNKFNQDVDLIVARDHQRLTLINTGVMIFKMSYRCISKLSTALTSDKYAHMYEHFPYEQGAIEDVFVNHQDQPQYNIESIHEISTPSKIYTTLIWDDKHLNHNEGDFIVHLAQMDNDHRNHIFEQHYQRLMVN